VTRDNPYHKIPESNWQHARKMRREPSRAEKMLWRYLRGSSLGINFRRQHPIGPFIVDFCSPECKFVIEIDGDSHATSEAEEYDARRTEYLMRSGFVVIRFRNSDVIENTLGVVENIAEEVKNVLAHGSTFPTPPLIPPCYGGRPEQQKSDPLRVAFCLGGGGMCLHMPRSYFSAITFVTRSVFPAVSFKR
jgi:very-short-patch-repair endonuclease